MSASFELTGNPQTGSLTLFTPLGNTVAKLQWTPAQATLRTRGEPQHFGSLQALVQHATGTDIPIAALFAWLQGDQATAPGWEADLQARADGRISARKLAPEPAAELKVILDRP
jgi:outer membrane lipoprotein LolB